MHQWICTYALSPLIFAIVIDVVTEHARKGIFNEILYADDLVLMSESLEDLRERFQRWRSALEGKRLIINVGKTKMMVSGMVRQIAMSKTDPCETCGKRVGSNAGCCTQCMKWIHGRCTKMKKGDLQDILLVEDAQMLEMAQKNQWRCYACYARDGQPVRC